MKILQENYYHYYGNIYVNKRLGSNPSFGYMFNKGTKYKILEEWIEDNLKKRKVKILEEEFDNKEYEFWDHK